MSGTWSQLLCALLLPFALAACTDEYDLNAANSSRTSSDKQEEAVQHVMSAATPKSTKDDSPVAQKADTQQPETPRETRAPRLTWGAPLTRVNGSALAMGEIDGYRLYYQPVDGERKRVIEINDPNETSLDLEGFSPGDYLFSISTRDIDGQESAPTREVLVSVL